MSKVYRLRKKRAFIFFAFACLIFVWINNVGSSEEVPVTSKIETMSVATVPSSTAAYTASTSTTQTTTIPHIDTPTCKAAALYCIDDEKLLYSDNISRRIAPASMTKLLTASVALKYMNTDEILTVGSEQYLVQPYSSLCGVQWGSTATLETFIKGLLLSSGNDAAYTIGVSTARKLNPNTYLTDTEAVERFCMLMNGLSSDIGMTDSHFVNPDGWDDDNQYTTVSDLLLLTQYAMTVPEIREAVGIYQMNAEFISGDAYEWKNSNLLLDPYSEYYCENAIGVKTGTTLNAGNCLISSFIIDGKTYIAIVAGCETDSDRYELTLKLLHYFT
ncbi:MAG: D-alanyl-D-alanine carboxypeptidase [Ruminococcus sp.]|nr:D-alanyl-D-alanine carboxypeptidase [Ruminococcus sp.]